MTVINGLKKAIGEYRYCYDIGEPCKIYLDLETASVYANPVEEPCEQGSIEITSELFKRYGKVSMDTMKNYCNMFIYNSAIVIDRYNDKNPIYTRSVVIDRIDVVYDRESEPEIGSIHICQTGDTKCDKTLDNRGDMVYNIDIPIEYMTGGIIKMEARLFVLTRKMIQIAVTKIYRR